MVTNLAQSHRLHRPIFQSLPPPECIWLYAYPSSTHYSQCDGSVPAGYTVIFRGHCAYPTGRWNRNPWVKRRMPQYASVQLIIVHRREIRAIRKMHIQDWIRRSNSNLEAPVYRACTAAIRMDIGEVIENANQMRRLERNGRTHFRSSLSHSSLETLEFVITRVATLDCLVPTLL